MALRLIEIQLPRTTEKETRAILDEFDNSSVWDFTYSDELFFAKIVIPAEETEKIMDLFEKRYSRENRFRLILHSLEAIIPRLKNDQRIQDQSLSKESQRPPRISREELYHDVEDASRFNSSYVIMVILSSIVASIGLMKQNIPAIIGSMVIAPLLGPNVALSLAATLGDMKLAFHALKVNLWGILIAFVFSAVIGFCARGFITDNVYVLSLSVDITDIILALSAGAAGTLAFTSGVPATLVGVMVAVALVPPLVIFGMLSGAGMFDLAWNALLIVMVNIISINLAGIVTFYFQGVRALSWWEEGKAKKMRSVAAIIWLALLLILTALIYIFRVDVTPQ